MKTLQIERLSHDLRGIAHADDLTWFVEGALPGESVEVRELMRRQQLVDAEVVTVLAAATERIQPACEYYGRCGGCALQHVDHGAQVGLKQQILLDQLVRIGKVKPEMVAPPLLSPAWEYRRRARLACRWSSDRKHLSVGLRERHSQEIVEIDHCAVLVPALQTLLQPVRACLSRWSQPRQLGHIELLAADNSVGVLLRLLATPAVADEQLLRDLSQTSGASIFLQLDDRQSVQFFCGAQSSLQVAHAGSDTELACLPGDFVQGNAAVNAQLVDAVLAALQPAAGDRVLEAFCGLGNFTLPLAKRVQDVVAVELSETMLTRAATKAVEQGIANIAWRSGNLEQFDPRKLPLPATGKILLDPPRDGAQAFCRDVNVEQVERIVYVSCNPSTLARDAGILAKRGFALRSVQFVDMFPQTAHIEAVAVFTADAGLLRKATKEKRVAKKSTLKKLRR